MFYVSCQAVTRMVSTRLPSEMWIRDSGKTNRVVVFDNNQVTDLDIEEGLARQKDLNQCLFEAQQTVAI